MSKPTTPDFEDDENLQQFFETPLRADHWDPVFTAAYLERLSVSVCNANAYFHHPCAVDFIRSLVSPVMRSRTQGLFGRPFAEPSDSFDAYLADVRRYSGSYPGRWWKVVDSKADVVVGAGGRECRRAKVWLFITGCDGVINMGAEGSRQDHLAEFVAIMHWKLMARERKWVWYKFEGIRGRGYFSV
jgi:hypothetical protein